MTNFSQQSSIACRLLRPTLVLVCCVGFAGVASAARAQQPEPYRFGDLVEVQLVNVEVWVTDDRGDPVPGLEASDFEVREDGQPVEIRFFAELDGERVMPTPDTRSPAPAEAEPDVAPALPQAPTVAPSHLVVYFDQLHLKPAGRQRVIRDLRDFLAAGPVLAERVLILSQDYSLATVATFGSSWQELDAALERMGKTAPAGGRVATEKRLALQRLQDIWKLGKQMGGRAGSSDPCDYFLPRAIPEVDLFARESRDRISISLDHLASAASFLTGLPGVKTMLYVSDSLERSPGSDLLTFVNGLCPVQDRAPQFIVSDELSLAFRELTRHANANQVTIYALQAGGLEGSFVGSADQGALEQEGTKGLDTALRFNERDGLINLAAETGGRAIFNRNDFDGELSQIAREMGTYYSLAYTPPHGGDRLEHRIDVDTKGKRWNVRHRRGYRDKSPDVRMTERLQGAVYLGLVANPMGVRLGAGEIRTDEKGNLTVPLHVMAPVANVALLPEEDALAAHLTLMVSTRNTKTQKGIFEQSAFRIRRQETEDSELVGVVIELTLPPGVHLIAVGVRDDTTGDTSFVTTTVELWPTAAGADG